MTLSPTAKKILYSILLVLVVMALGYLLYVVFFRRPAPPVINENINNVNIGLPNINELLENVNVRNVNEVVGIPGVDRVASGGFTETDILTPEISAQDPSISTDGALRYYLPTDGKFYTVDSSGNIRQLGTGQFRGVSTVTWSDTTDETILEFPDGSNIYYNLDTNQQVTLPAEYEEFDFSPTSSQIAFKYLPIDPERRVLAVASPDGSSARTLESLGNNEHRVDVEWSPTGKIAASYAEFIDFNRQELGFIGLKDENFKGTIVEGHGLQSEYSADGQQLLYSVYSSSTDYQPSLWIVDVDGENIGKNRKELQINTFADKCAFSADSTTVYCGVPSESKYGFGLEPGLLDGISDEIYKINLTTGTKTKIAVPVDDTGNDVYSVEEIVVSEDGTKLFFRDATSGQLVKIDLQ